MFRAIRSWRKNHKVYLMDKSWVDVIGYYSHIWDYVRRTLNIATYDLPPVRPS